MTTLDRISRKFIRCQNHATSKHLCHLLHLCQAEIETLTSKMETDTASLHQSKKASMSFCSYLFIHVHPFRVLQYLFEGIIQSKKVMECHVISKSTIHAPIWSPQESALTTEDISKLSSEVTFCFFAFSQTERYEEIQMKTSEH